MKVLLIEPDAKVARRVQRHLAEEEFVVDVARDEDEGARLALACIYDCVILHACQLAADIRRAGQAVPILLLTTLGASEDIARARELGVDDVLIEPFVGDELLTRVRALLRRGGAERMQTLRFGDLEVDRLRHAARRGQRRLELTPTEFQLLEYFLLRPERVLTRSELLKGVWNLRVDPASNVVDVHIGNLRRKLAAEGEEEIIHTVRGVGFILECRERPAVRDRPIVKVS